jgi:Eukaryotic aspartyl protease
MAATIRVPITNVYMDGDYTGLISVGSQRQPANVILDTGSSTLAINGHLYDPTQDPDATITNIAQEVGYEDNSSWIGGIARTDVVMGSGTHEVTLPKVNVAVAYHETENMFGKSGGILGLAYTRLNNAFTMPGPTLPPKYHFNEIQGGKVTYLEPYFTQLEKTGVVANKYAFYTLRSLISTARSDHSKDPINNGFLILGGGEESTDLYSGAFQSARVVHDTYYNTNLKAVIVGSTPPIPVHPPTKASKLDSNSIVDSGTNSLALDPELFNTILSRLSKAQAHALKAGHVTTDSLDLASWPTLTFVLEGEAGTDAQLKVSPTTYWQLNASDADYAEGVIGGDGDQGQSILGLPLMNNYFTIFDRAVDHGLGAVRFAATKRPKGV